MFFFSLLKHVSGPTTGTSDGVPITKLVASSRGTNTIRNQSPHTCSASFPTRHHRLRARASKELFQQQQQIIIIITRGLSRRRVLGSAGCLTVCLEVDINQDQQACFRSCQDYELQQIRIFPWQYGAAVKNKLQTRTWIFERYFIEMLIYICSFVCFFFVNGFFFLSFFLDLSISLSISSPWKCVRFCFVPKS